MRKPTNIINTPPGDNESWGSYNAETKLWSEKVYSGKAIREWILNNISKINAPYIIRNTKTGELLKFASLSDRNAWISDPEHNLDKILQEGIFYSTYTPPFSYTSYYKLSNEELDTFLLPTSITTASKVINFSTNYVYIAIPNNKNKFTAITAGYEDITNLFVEDNLINKGNYSDCKIYKFYSALPLDINVTITFKE